MEGPPGVAVAIKRAMLVPRGHGCARLVLGGKMLITAHDVDDYSIPDIEILEGPPQVTLAIKEDMVLPRRQGCANRVPGGILVVTAKDVREPLDTKITYRLKYKTKDGDRPRGYTYRLSLFP